MLLNTVMILIVIELGATVLLSLTSSEVIEAPLAEQVETFKQKQLSLAYYQEQDWARAYWDEHMQIVDHWNYEPYTLSGAPGHSRANISMSIRSGIRAHAWTQIVMRDSFRVFVFGGSTMWGYGAPDWGTIPAYLQAGLHDIEDNICVVNHADVAFNSTQSLIKLMLELQRGNAPDMVIFYDGANEVTIANITGQSGTHFYLDQIESAVRGNLAFGSPEDEAAQTSPVADLIARTATARLLSNRFNTTDSDNTGDAPPPCE